MANKTPAKHIKNKPVRFDFDNLIQSTAHNSVRQKNLIINDSYTHSQKSSLLKSPKYNKQKILKSPTS